MRWWSAESWAGSDLIDDDEADVQSRAQRLRLGHVAGIVVRETVRKDAGKLCFVGLL